MASFGLLFVKTILIFGFFLGVFIGLSYGIIRILRGFNIEDASLYVELSLFLTLFITGIIVLLIERQKWLKTSIRVFPLKGLSVLSILYLTLATNVFVKGMYWLDEFFFNIPINATVVNHNFSLSANIMIIVNAIILSPIIEEVVFRKWILGQFKNQRKQIYAGLIISSLMFSLIHDIMKRLLSFRILFFEASNL